MRSEAHGVGVNRRRRSLGQIVVVVVRNNNMRGKGRRGWIRGCRSKDRSKGTARRGRGGGAGAKG